MELGQLSNSPVKTLVRQFPGLPDLLCQPWFLPFSAQKELSSVCQFQERDGCGPGQSVCLTWQHMGAWAARDGHHSVHGVYLLWQDAEGHRVLWGGHRVVQCWWWRLITPHWSGRESTTKLGMHTSCPLMHAVIFLIHRLQLPSSTVKCSIGLLGTRLAANMPNTCTSLRFLVGPDIMCTCHQVNERIG